MKEWSNELMKQGIVPPKPLEEMTEAELYEWRNSLDPDAMGFDGDEFPGEQEGGELLVSDR